MIAKRPKMLNSDKACILIEKAELGQGNSQFLAFKTQTFKYEERMVRKNAMAVGAHDRSKKQRTKIEGLGSISFFHKKPRGSSDKLGNLGRRPL